MTPIDKSKQEALSNEIDEISWLQAASRNPAFAFLADPEEDIYSITDGKPFNQDS